MQINTGMCLIICVLIMNRQLGFINNIWSEPMGTTIHYVSNHGVTSGLIECEINVPQARKVTHIVACGVCVCVCTCM